MREIPLSRGLSAIVDDEDYERVACRRWHAAPAKQRPTNFYARSSYGEYMHRLIAGASRGQYVDHKDHNGLNNLRSNLRICTHSQNCANARLSNPPPSGYRGVCWDRRKKKFVASVTCGGKYHFLGRFDDPREAALIRDKGAVQLHGKFAILNFPCGDLT